MPKAQVLALAAEFFKSWPDCTDMAQDVDDCLRSDLEDLGLTEDALDDLIGEVTEAVEKCFTEAAAMLNLKAQRMVEERKRQEMRVQAVIDQFHLANPERTLGETDVPRLTDALYGINGGSNV